MTQVDEGAHSGYFGDPYPIHLAPGLVSVSPQYFSGTTQKVLACKHPIKPGCFDATPLTVSVDQGLQADLGRADAAFFNKINDNIYQAADGAWHMAITFYVHKKSDPKVGWTVIAHAHPEAVTSLAPPTKWLADKILVGSLDTKGFANYDGKYFEDDKKLYLIYSKRLTDEAEHEPAHDGIVAQQMKSPSTPESSEPVVLLGPSTSDDGFNSEFFHTDPLPRDRFKLIETGNITKIDGKYVMAYSAGDYQQLNYKTGLAFSDTLLPRPGESYRRILEEDTKDVWGQPDHQEVRYLMQSQKPDWPNYVASQVIAPGVPSIVQQPDGRYFLFFDGYLPGDAPQSNSTPNNPLNLDPTYRRPFYMRLEVHIPSNRSVGSATEEELADWIKAARDRTD
jgi:hypothetical protein